MKKRLFIVLVLLLSLFTGGVLGQSLDSLSQCKSVEDSLRCIQTIFLKQKDSLIGKPAKNTFEVFKSILPVKYAVSHETSPWVDPQGKDYIDGISLYYMTIGESGHLRDKGAKLIYFSVYFEDTHVDYQDFIRLVAEDRKNYNKYLTYFEHFIVKRIVIYRRDWSNPRGDTLKLTIEK